MPVDPFAPDVFVVDYIGTVESVQFVESDFGAIQAVIRNRYDEPFIGDDGEVHDGRTEFVSVGTAKEWQAVEGGTAFQHTSGDPEKRTRAQSAYFQLLARAVELVGREGMLSKDPAYNHGLHSEAAWLGKRFHWVTEGAGETVSFKDRETGERRSVVSKGHQMPVEFLGEQDELPLADLGTPTDYDVDGLGLDESTVVDLMTLAKGYSYGDFQAKGIGFLGDLQDDPRRAMLASALNEPSFYETLRRT